MVELDKLTRLIQKEAANRQQSETSMTQLLEGMHQKLHTEVISTSLHVLVVLWLLCKAGAAVFCR